MRRKVISLGYLTSMGNGTAVTSNIKNRGASCQIDMLHPPRWFCEPERHVCYLEISLGGMQYLAASCLNCHGKNERGRRQRASICYWGLSLLLFFPPFSPVSTAPSWKNLEQDHGKLQDWFILEHEVYWLKIGEQTPKLDMSCTRIADCICDHSDLGGSESGR
ncbi:hypothetical protein OPV22_017573 [Ensete ventricosum]|uniref:Cytochrome c domain-containing protein n=1 Tax=Ensete ventricosum TaxID=4639 RepID=A0AAV8R2H3_ENSVE|nr:hypothetical protein OPV22_017573 [Ensete ventricosum]